MSKAKRVVTHQREEDLHETMQLHLRGWTQQEIAKELNVSQQAVSKRIHKILQQWRDSNIRDMDELKMRELKKLDALERQYWESWQKSLEDFEETTDTTGTDLIGDPIDKHVIKRRGQTGNPAYLEGVRKCVELRCKILGINTSGDVTNIDVAVNNPIAIVKMDMNAL